MERFSENNYYQSVSWALALAREARDEGIIKSDPALQDIFRVNYSFLLFIYLFRLFSF